MFTQTLRNNSHIFFFAFPSASLWRVQPLKDFRNLFPYLTVSHDLPWKAKRLSRCWGITLPPRRQAQVFDAMCASTVDSRHAEKRDHKTKHKRIQGEPAFCFYNLVCGREVFAQGITSQEAQIQLFFTAQLKRQKEDSLSRLCLGILERTKVKSAQKLTP